jgi:ABC-type transporter Mla subunit MlaD
MRPGISATLDNLSAASASLAAATDRLEQWTVEHNEEIGDFAEGGLGQVPALVSDTRAALRELEKLMRSLREDPSRLIYRPEEGGDEDD